MINDLKPRTRKFALSVIQLVERLPKNQVSWVVGKQLIRCGTSVGANYRSACRAKSGKDFIAKMGIVEEEVDESIYWLELLEEANVIPCEAIADLKNEANQLTAITVASIRTARSRLEKK